jgi:hypothetical protein
MAASSFCSTLGGLGSGETSGEARGLEGHGIKQTHARKNAHAFHLKIHFLRRSITTPEILSSMKTYFNWCFQPVL